MLVDHSFDIDDHTYQLTRIHHLHGHIVRIDIRRNEYARQSHAVVQILSDTKTWTNLASAPVPTWYPDTPHRLNQGDNVPRPLRELADSLLERARTILTI